MSPIAKVHCLVAVANGAPLQLCDPVSGAVVHNLVGHKSDVWAVCWSSSSEWHVLSGGTDDQARPSPCQFLDTVISARCPSHMALNGFLAAGLLLFYFFFPDVC